MSELCRFRGVIIRIYGDDHGPPHFHAISGDDQVLIDIELVSVYRDELHPRLEREVLRWADARQPELRDAWRRVQRHEPASRIAPLD